MWWAPLAIHGAKMVAGFMQDKNDQALWKAVHEADLAATAIALHQGGNPNITDGDDCPVLFYAISTGDAKLVKLLIEKGAKIDTESPDGLTPLMRAVCDQHESVVKILIEKGCSVSQFNQTTGDYPINEAALTGHAGILSFLLNQGADANSRTGRGHTPLITILGQQALPIASPTDVEGDEYKVAASRMNLDRGNAKWLIKLLLDAGANPNHAEFNGFSALMIASVLDDADLILQLCEHGAKLNATNTEGNTPLMAAAHFGNVNAMKALIEKGANPRAKDAEDETALDIAKNNGHVKAVELLAQYSQQ